MTEESTKHHWLRIGAIALITFIVAFLAFYIVMEIMIHRISDPMYNIKRVEKIIKKQERDFRKYENGNLDNPFEPKIRPMMVNLVKEPNEYKVIIDLTQLDGNENAVNVNVNENELVVSGEMDKKVRGSEKIISFSQTYYLDEELNKNAITKERKGEKYIITIPFEDKD